jgi:hypothetical protein
MSIGSDLEAEMISHFHNSSLMLKPIACCYRVEAGSSNFKMTLSTKAIRQVVTNVYGRYHHIKTH